MSTFVYLPIFFGIVAWEFKWTNYITPEMTAFPKRKFLFMGLFDALSGICMLFGGIHTSGSFQALLLNAVIPFTMAMSIIFLKTKYLKTQYAGALVIMAGVAVVIVPTIVGGGSSDNSVVFNLIFLLSTLPQAFSSIYKELAFGDIDLDVNYLVSKRAVGRGWIFDGWPGRSSEPARGFHPARLCIAVRGLSSSSALHRSACMDWLAVLLLMAERLLTVVSVTAASFDFHMISKPGWPRSSSCWVSS